MLNGVYENYCSTYFEYISKTKNIELNFHRYHYVYVWSEILKEFYLDSAVITGICGDSFVRDGISTTSKSEKFIYKLSLTTNIKAEIKNYVSKKKIYLSEFGISEKEASEYLHSLFQILNGKDLYYKHYYVKIIVRVLNYFGSEISSENSFLPTYTPFLDVDYLKLLSNSKYSIFKFPFIEKKNIYRLLSQRFYAELINYLYPMLLDIQSNRGYPLKYALSKKYFLNSLYSQYNFSKKKNIKDIDYEVWDAKLLPNGFNNNYNFDENLKLKIINSEL